MRQFVFMVKDRATEMFGQPMFLVASGQAIRSFTDEVNRAAEDNQLYQHPDDFDLYECGTFETSTGEFDVFVPRVLIRGKDVSMSFKSSN